MRRTKRRGGRANAKVKVQAQALAKACRLLASARFAGRGSGEPGGWRAASWVARQARAEGLVAWLGRRSLFQPVAVGVSTFSPGGGNQYAALESASAHENLLTGGQILLRSQHAKVALEQAPILFVGFGIVAPQYHWDDYAGLDVSGKTVLLLPNDPGRFGQGFQGERMTYYGRWEYKYEEAARQGAVGVIVLHTEALFGSGFALVKQALQRSFSFLPDAIRSRLAFEGICDEAVGRSLLAQVDVDLDHFLAKPWPMGRQARLLASTLSLRLCFDVRVRHCRNVLGMHKGKLFPRQCVLLCAHWDHLGKASEPGGDRGYYPGAVDNAMGVSVLLDIARRLADAGPLRRTVLFAWTTAEEVGMLGSTEVARWVRAQGLDIVAALNVDGFVPIGRTRDISLVDGDQSDLPMIFQRAAKRLHRQVTLDDQPSAGLFFRSDQASFAKVGIATVQVSTGDELLHGGIERGRQCHEDYDLQRYHSTADVFERYWDFPSLCADIDVLYETLLSLADSSLRPSLNV